MIIRFKGIFSFDDHYHPHLSFSFYLFVPHTFHSSVCQLSPPPCSAPSHYLFLPLAFSLLLSLLFHTDAFGLDLRSLALFRVSLALCTIGDLMERASDLTAHYTDQGIITRSLVSDKYSNEYSLSIPSHPFLLLYSSLSR